MQTKSSINNYSAIDNTRSPSPSKMDDISEIKLNHFAKTKKSENAIKNLR